MVGMREVKGGEKKGQGKSSAAIPQILQQEEMQLRPKLEGTTVYTAGSEALMLRRLLNA